MQNHRVAKWLPVAVPNTRVVNRKQHVRDLSAVKAGIGIAPLSLRLEHLGLVLFAR